MPEYFSTFRNKKDVSVETVSLQLTHEENLSESSFVLVKEKESYKPIVNIDIGADFSYFKDTQVVNNIVLIGWSNYFATFDLTTRKQTLLSLDGYFGNFRLYDNKIFVCSAGDVTCLSTAGDIVWKSDTIAIDGVIINSFDNDIIHCSCEWEPPGGWQPYKLDFHTGKTIKKFS